MKNAYLSSAVFARWIKSFVQSPVATSGPVWETPFVRGAPGCFWWWKCCGTWFCEREESDGERVSGDGRELSGCRVVSWGAIVWF